MLFPTMASSRTMVVVNESAAATAIVVSIYSTESNSRFELRGSYELDFSSKTTLFSDVESGIRK